MSVLEEVEQFKEEQDTVETAAQAAAEPVQEVAEPRDAHAIVDATTTAQQALQDKMVQQVMEGDKNMKDIAKDLTYLAGASRLQNNQEFSEEYDKALAQQLIRDLQDEGKRAAIVEQAKKQEARNIRSTAFYNGCKPIFKMLNIDEAYGLVPMIFTVVLLMAPFLLVSFVRFCINAVNSVFEAISGFTKPAARLCTVAIYAMITIAALIGLMYLIDFVFGTSIIKVGAAVVS